jgi:hypothetical protein
VKGPPPLAKVLLAGAAARLALCSLLRSLGTNIAKATSPIMGTATKFAPRDTLNILFLYSTRGGITVEQLYSAQVVAAICNVKVTVCAIYP